MKIINITKIGEHTIETYYFKRNRKAFKYFSYLIGNINILGITTTGVIDSWHSYRNNHIETIKIVKDRLVGSGNLSLGLINKRKIE